MTPAIQLIENNRVSPEWVVFVSIAFSERCITSIITGLTLH